jgi:TPR repeat protein
MLRKNLLIIFCLILFNFTALISAEKSYHSALKKKADAGDAISQNNLGHLYLDGYKDYEIPQDINKAIYYLSKAAAQEQVNAMTTVGWIYFNGDYGAPKDYEEAINWSQKASDMGCSIATYNLGLFYYGGHAGVKQDLKIAKKYWLLSISQSLDFKNICVLDAKELLKEINDYNKKPSKEMIKLRDFFIGLIDSEKT